MPKSKTITSEQQSEILLLIKRQQRIVGRYNSLITNFLMFWGLPQAVDLLFMRNPIFNIYDMLKSRAETTFDSWSINSVDEMLHSLWSNYPEIETILTENHKKQFFSLYREVQQVNYNNVDQLLSKTFFIIKNTKHANSNRADKSLDIFRLLTITIHTTLNHIFNQSQIKFIFPYLFLVRALSLGIKTIVIDRLTNQLFPRGLFPLVMNDTIEFETINQEYADEVIERLKLKLSRLSRFDMLIKLISAIYVIVYPIYVSYQVNNLPTPNLDIQEMDFWNCLMAPVAINLLMISACESFSTAKECWHAYSLQSTLDSQLKKLQRLTNTLEKNTITWSTTRGSNLDNSYFKLKLNNPLKFKEETIHLSRKFFLRALRNVIADKLEVLAANDNSITFSANDWITDDQFNEILDLLPRYLKRLTDLLKQFPKITQQYKELCTLAKIEYQFFWRTDENELPVLSFLMTPDLLERIKLYLKSYYQFNDTLYRIDVNQPMSDDDYCKAKSIFNTSTYKPINPLNNQNVNFKKIKKRKPLLPKPELPAQEQVDPLEIRWSNSSVYYEKDPARSTVSALDSRVIPNHCLFAKYTGKTKDSDIEKHFKDIIVNQGKIVAPKEKQGIVYLKNTKWMRDSVTNELFEATYKVKSQHKYYKHLRLFGRETDITNTPEGKQRVLISFSTFAITHT